MATAALMTRLDVIAFGATHRDAVALYRGVLLVNPGSPTHPARPRFDLSPMSPVRTHFPLDTFLCARGPRLRSTL
ncbi:MAG: hypothetical protein DME01_12695 [Candidatus Rokuibacteriota bacterium]|nr:MAG: hypothetical protein DME01_12695 [Candidatus Rokubacteria bacterium]